VAGLAGRLGASPGCRTSLVRGRPTGFRARGSSESAWVGFVEFGEGFAPGEDFLAFDEAGWLVGAFPGGLPAGEAFAGAFVLDVDDGEPEHLDDGVVAGEVASGFGDLAELVVQALDGVGGVEQPPDRPGEREERDERVPGVFPDPDRLRVLLPPRGAGELEQGQLGGVGVGCGVDLAELFRDLGGVAAGDRAQGVPDEVDIIQTSG
jgi:hypothetical protein